MKNLNRSLTGGIVLILFLFIDFSTKAQIPDTIFQPVTDAELRQGQPLINFSLLSTMTLNPRSTSEQSSRGLIKFNLNFDSLPENIQVTNAKLRIYTVGASHPATSKQIAAHRVINEWTGSNASWNRRTTNNWASSGGDYVSSVTGLANALPAFNWIEIDVTSDLQAFRLDSTLNKGWILKIHSEDNSGHNWSYATKEYLGGIFAPQLIINYGFFLPVEYKNFVAKQEQDYVKLEWNTLKEIDNDRFEIEKSIDGKIWEKIGSINGNGFSTSTLKYTYIDKNPVVSYNYYRLKQIDFNGKYSYSQIVSVKMENAAVQILNVVKNLDYFEIKLSAEEDQPSRISIIDIMGRIILSEHLNIEKGINTFNYKSGNIVSGIYIVTIDNGKEIISFKTYLK